MAAEFLGPRGTTYKWHELPDHIPMSLTYDDVTLVPQTSTVETRADCDTSVQFGPYVLGLPLIAAPMDTVTGKEMVLTTHKLGAMGALPRAKNREEKQNNLALCELFSKDNIPCLYSVGLRQNDKEGIKDAVNEAGELKLRGAQMVLVDFANGGMESGIRAARDIKNKHDLIMVLGNIATYNQAQKYREEGIDYARVGVGGGGVCSTRIVTGVGVPQLSAVFDTASSGIDVIADGGIREPGDVPKAIAAGAKLVMIGSKFGATDESPGKIIWRPWGRYKIVRGQASPAYMLANGTAITEHRAAEGVEERVRYRGSVVPIVNRFRGGLVSAMSYSNAHDLAEFQQNAIFVLGSHAAQREAHPHINR